MMTGKGIAKLIEELGEVQQVLGALVQTLGKRLAYYSTEEHPDGGPPLKQRMEDEIGDVLAACTFVGLLHGLDMERVAARRERKLALFREWHERTDNNEHGIDAPRSA
jgi:NTP pyrophosphatase (non-canonical NTP hydrolase)